MHAGNRNARNRRHCHAILAQAEAKDCAKYDCGAKGTDGAGEGRKSSMTRRPFALHKMSRALAPTGGRIAQKLPNGGNLPTLTELFSSSIEISLPSR